MLDVTPSRWEDAYLSDEKKRVYAFLYIPDDATYREALGWLSGRLPRHYDASIRQAICRFHLEDNILQVWRADRRVGLAPECTVHS